MKRYSFFLFIFLITHVCPSAWANEPESASLFAYTTDGRHNGLLFAWSIDNENWHPIGPGHRYVRSDFGHEKRMLNPVLIRSGHGEWHCLWKASETDEVYAQAVSDDLVKWKRQSYAADKDVYLQTCANLRSTIKIQGETFTGTKHQVEWSLIDGLIKDQKLATYKAMLNAEKTDEDLVRFASLQPVEARIHVDAAKSKPISDLLIGVFFEDLNYAADGGIYAELIQNRGFEYTPADKQGRDPDWNSQTAWQLKGKDANWKIDTVAPIHSNNKHYVKMELQAPGASLVNEGFDGIVLKAGDKYNFSLFTRLDQGKGGKVSIRLVSKTGEICAEGSLKATSSNWKKQEIVLTSTQTVADARLEICLQFTGIISLDMVSLFPQKTFKGRKNGLRADLAQSIADINPRFVRFPGGCLAHGDGLGNMYRWKNTVGPLETRKPQSNIWRYHQTVGLGYFEYFQFCEDIGAEPLPVLAAGVPCQNSVGGQQGGIPICEMDDYIQEIFDLIEWANGSVNTTWGKKRAEAGHPKPFNLKYIGVGNEDQISDVFEERFTLIYNALKEKHPEIVVIGTSGPFSEGTDYVEGWDIANKLGIPMIDEHYYQQPGWFIHNQDYYDRYDRSKSKVYLGEYAAHLPGRPNNLETALAEALYLTSVERNGDIVSMTSYAPLLAKEGFTQWNPDLIYFNNIEVKPTVGYYVQKLYGQNAGDEYLEAQIYMDKQSEAVKKRVASSVVRDSRTGDVIVKLVNLLPVAVKPILTLENYELNNASVVKTLLTGTPADKTVHPIESNCNVNEMLVGELPPYSFTVYRIKDIGKQVSSNLK